MTDVVIWFGDNPFIEQRMNCYIMYALLEGLYGKCFHPKVSGFQTGMDTFSEILDLCMEFHHNLIIIEIILSN